MNTLLAVFFAFTNLAMWTSEQSEVFRQVKSFLSNRKSPLYPFVFVFLNFIGFSLWESFLYFLFGFEQGAVLRAVVGSTLCLLGFLAGFNRGQVKKGLQPVLTLGPWQKKTEAQLLLGGVGWGVLLGAWGSMILFGPWLVLRWKKLQSEVIK